MWYHNVNISLYNTSLVPKYSSIYPLESIPYEVVVLLITAVVNDKQRKINEKIVISAAFYATRDEACTPFRYLLCLGIDNTIRYFRTSYII